MVYPALLLSLEELGVKGSCHRVASTTNLEGSEKRAQRIRPCLTCCLVAFLIASNWLFESFDSLLAHTLNTPLKAPCYCLLNHHHKSVERRLFP